MSKIEFLKGFENIQSQIRKHENTVQTEAGTKTSLVLPFLYFLGYDIFNATEVIPEHNADIGGNADKVDYGIVLNQRLEMIIEVKFRLNGNIQKYIAQLYKYFSVTDAKIAVLTDGITYLFFSDTKELNRMDTEPFYTLNVLEVNDTDQSFLNGLNKDTFSSNDLLEKAMMLKCQNSLSSLMDSIFKGSNERFIDFAIDNLVTENIHNADRDYISSFIKEYVKEKTSFDKSSLQESAITEIEGTMNSTSESAGIPEGFCRLNSYTGKKIEKLFLCGEVSTINNNKDILILILERIIKEKPDQLLDLINNEVNFINKGTHRIFSFQKSQLPLYSNKSPQQHRLSNGGYVFTGMDSNRLISVSEKLLSVCGYNNENMLFKIKES